MERKRQNKGSGCGETEGMKRMDGKRDGISGWLDRK